jgi:hypothetical protein
MEVRPPQLTSPLVTWKLNRKTHVVEEKIEPRQEPENAILFDLRILLKEKPFPFRMCPECQTVFVPIKGQRHCSPKCTSRAIERARKIDRQPYMREYMRNYRMRNYRESNAKSRPTKNPKSKKRKTG